MRRSNVLNVNRIVITCISNFTTNKDTKKDDKKIEVINDPTKSKSVLQRALSSTMDVIRNPSANLSYAWVMVKETADHYWVTKLFSLIINLNNFANIRWEPNYYGQILKRQLKY